MRYKAEMDVSGDKLLYKCFLSEASKKDRSAVKINQKKDGVRFEIEAKDVTAFKASINSIVKLLEVHAKLKDVK